VRQSFYQLPIRSGRSEALSLTCDRLL
jgi:hypothetical protein